MTTTHLFLDFELLNSELKFEVDAIGWWKVFFKVRLTLVSRSLETVIGLTMATGAEALNAKFSFSSNC